MEGAERLGLDILGADGRDRDIDGAERLGALRIDGAERLGALILEPPPPLRPFGTNNDESSSVTLSIFAVVDCNSVFGADSHHAGKEHIIPMIATAATITNSLNFIPANALMAKPPPNHFSNLISHCL